MFTLYHTGIRSLLPSLETGLPSDRFRLQEAGNGTELSAADVFVIGPDEEDPVRQVQAIGAADRHLSVLILVPPARFPRVKQALQFAPYVGKNALCLSYTPALDLSAAVGSAAQRTRQRRSFSRIHSAPSPLTTLASASVRVESFGIFLEQAPVAALLADNESRIQALNRKARDLFGSEVSPSLTLQDLFPGFTLHELRLQTGLKKGEATRVVPARERYFELQLSEVHNEEGKTLHIILANDITEQKRKEEALTQSEALFRSMAETLPQKIWTADETGHRNFFNQRWLEYTGRPLSELKGWGWIDSVHPEDREANVEAWKHSVASGTDFQFEHRLLRHDGTYRWHLVRGVANRDGQGKVRMWIGTNTDIHEQIAFTEELERRVRERTLELEKSNSELEQFVYVTSHDLQEPLRKIRMFGEIVKEQTQGLEGDWKRYIQKISDTAFRMNTLLKDLLNFTQMGRLDEPEDTDLGSIVAQVLVDLELLISEKSAEVRVGELPRIPAVPVQMQQLFYNLIGNALKFSRPGVPPLIELVARPAAEASVARQPYLLQGQPYQELIVRDNGIGFDPRYAEQIFHIFQRLHNRAEYGGTGIGLALCKKVVSNHHGAIWAESGKDQGAAFHILLPTHH